MSFDRSNWFEVLQYTTPGTNTNALFIEIRNWQNEYLNTPVYLQMSEYDGDADLDNLGRIVCRIARAHDGRFYVTQHNYRSPSEGEGAEAARSDVILVHLPNDGEWWPAIPVPIRGDGPQRRSRRDSEPVYEISFTFKIHIRSDNGGSGEHRLLAPRPTNYAGGLTRRQRRLVAVSAERMPSCRDSQCIFQGVENRVRDLKQFIDEAKDALPDPNYRLGILNSVKKLSESYDDWWGHFQDGFQGRIDSEIDRLENTSQQYRDRAENQAERVAELLKSEDFRNHAHRHTRDEVLELLQKVAESGFFDTRAGAACGYGSRESGSSFEAGPFHPQSQFWENVLTWSSAGTLNSAALTFLTELVPTWVRVNPNVLVQRMETLIGGKKVGDWTIPGDFLGFHEITGEEMIDGLEHFMSREQGRTMLPYLELDSPHLNRGYPVYRVRPDLVIPESSLRVGGGLLAVCAFAASIAKLRTEPNARNLADVVSGTMPIVEFSAYLVAISSGSLRAGNYYVNTSTWLKWFGRASTATGTSLALWDTWTNFEEHDFDAAAFYLISAMGMGLTLIANPYVVLAGTVIAVVASIAATYADDNDWDKWALQCCYGRNPSWNAKDSLGKLTKLMNGARFLVETELEASGMNFRLVLKPRLFRSGWEMDVRGNMNSRLQRGEDMEALASFSHTLQARGDNTDEYGFNISAEPRGRGGGHLAPHEYAQAFSVSGVIVIRFRNKEIHRQSFDTRGRQA